MVNWPSNPQEPQFLSPFSIRFPVKGHGPWDQAQVLHSQVMHRRQPYHDEATVYYFIFESKGAGTQLKLHCTSHIPQKRIEKV